MDEKKVIVKPDKKLSLNTGIELPIDGLPPTVRLYIESVCQIYHCPMEFVTAAVLATASTAVGKKIKVNEGKYPNMPVLWFVFVAPSGSNKTFPIKLVTKPLRQIDAELYKAYKEQHDDWKAVPVKERTDDEPKCPSIVLDDCTDERRSEILYMNNDYSDVNGVSGNKRGTILICPEMKGMFDSRNQYQNGGTAPISKMLRLFDCDDIKVDRKGSFTMLIKNPFCNVLGDLQTGMLRATFGSELFMTNGLNQRFLFCIAENIEYPKRNHDTLPREIEDKWSAIVRMLYENIYRGEGNVHRTLFRTTDGEVRLGKEADALYNQYYNELQIKKDKAQTDYERSIYSKLQIHVLRLAGAVHALEVAEEKGSRDDYYTIRENTMEYAIRCMAYFERMAFIVYERLIAPSEVKPANELTNAEILREFMRRYPSVSQNALATLINKAPAYICKVMKAK